MLYNSLKYLIFLPLLWTAYQLIPQRFRWLLLLCASYYFYMCWKPEYIFLIVISTTVSYLAGIFISLDKGKKFRLVCLLSSLGINLGILFVFKYFNFFSEAIRLQLNYFNIFMGSTTFHFLLPVGISFYTFQTVSYTIDIYSRRIKPETHFGKYALYVSFFPQLVAGPIERSKNLLPQLKKSYQFNYAQTSFGLKLIIWGLIKKIVISDRLAMFVNTVYDNPEHWEGFSLTLATLFFGFQIYCDFSGYSDIAIGSAKLFGINLIKNFDRPYFSASIPEFWKRWHISLSTWFKDYLYVPLGGNRNGQLRLLRNLAITFLVSGLWHGANWTFIVWGGLHAGYMVFHRIFQTLISRFPQTQNIPLGPLRSPFVKIVFTFTLVCFAWIFFRANSLEQAFYITTHLHTGWGDLLNNFNDTAFIEKNIFFNQKHFEFIISIIMLGVLFAIEFVQYKNYRITDLLSSWHFSAKLALYIASIMVLIGFGFIDKQQFIYFQF